MTLIEVEGLVKRFAVRGRNESVHAVNDVSFTVDEDESLGLVGESGSGKTTIGRCLLRLVEPTEGSVHFRGRDLTSLSAGELRTLRAKIQVVFQEPFESLSPRLTVGEIVAEPLLLHRPELGRPERARRVRELLEKVRLRPELSHRRPHELSGGQQQRVGIARAIATQPEFVVLDEPTSSLDVSVRAQILDLLLSLQRSDRLSYLFISHDLSTIQYSCTKVAVLYLGRIVEIGPTERVFADPRHPYTRALLSAVLRPDGNRARRRIVLAGEMPSAVDLPPGCPFASRCPVVLPECSTALPRLREVAGRGVRCLRAEETPGLMD